MSNGGIEPYGNPEILVIGAGPAGLFATECLLMRGFRVSLYDRMPSPGCKFIVAGNHGGLNITNSAGAADFASRYGVNSSLFSRLLEDFSPGDMIEWLSRFGISVHEGSGGKIFPDGVTVSSLLSRWLARLESYSSFSFFPNHALTGIGEKKRIVFKTAQGVVERNPDVALFALGGASWPSTGSDGVWARFFHDRGIGVEPFLPANCGFEADWPEFLTSRFSNIPLKNVALTVASKQVRGELMLTPYGLEGGVVYSLGSSIRDEITLSGFCIVFLDLLPDMPTEKALSRLGGGPGKESVSNWLRKKLGLSAAALLLLRAACDRAQCDSDTQSPRPSSVALREPLSVVRIAKALPVTLFRPRPIEEAISSAGGIRFAEVDERLMLKRIPGWFCAGEMLDWESPTGGFLLQGCFATAYRAALGAAAWLSCPEN
jgi:uncharacterized flavoprotein (TIGR03862 family)